MTESFDDIKKSAQYLVTAWAPAMKIYDEMDRMYFMDDPDIQKTAQREDLKLSISPDARNKLDGAARLLHATDPVWDVSKTDEADDRSSDFEEAARAMWDASGKLNGTPVHYDLILSGLLYDGAHVSITRTSDLVKYAKGQSPAFRARAEWMAQRTPIIFDVWNPRDCYPLFDRYGLAAHLHRVESRKQDIVSAWGTKAENILSRHKATDEVTLCEWWSLDSHCVWVEGVGDAILLVPNRLPAIPVVAGQAYGSTRLFSKIEEQVQPFLYTANKSQMWFRQNLGLTVLFSQIYRVGMSPLLAWTKGPGQEDKHLAIDTSNPIGIVELGPGENLQQILKGAVDPVFFQASQIADQKMEESTIYSQALGQSLGATAPFSSVALLSQAGRLPLVSPQRRLGWLIGRAMETAFRLLKAEGGVKKIRGGSSITEIKANDIPDDLEIMANLEITLPQDKLQMSQIALLLSQGDKPLTSQAWARNEILQMGQSDAMDEEIWTEQAAQMFKDQFFRDQLQVLLQRLQGGGQPGQPQPGQAPGPEQSVMPPQVGMPSGLPPEMMSNGSGGPLPPRGMG